MNKWLNLLYWFGGAVASGQAIFLLFKITRIDLLSLGELIIALTVSGVFATGIVRTFSDWSLPICILAGAILAYPMFGLSMAALALGMYFVGIWRRE
ncbi:hypothetical protein EON83_14640 [bacterium]|nr:MAG: hypothetical protein EON83_14640 [bacterium]